MVDTTDKQIKKELDALFEQMKDPDAHEQALHDKEKKEYVQKSTTRYGF